MTRLPCPSRAITTVCLTLALLAACGDRGTKGNQDPSSTQTDDAQNAASGALGSQSVTVEPSLRARLGIEFAPIGHANLKVTARGTAVVLDAAALIAELADLDAGRAEANAAHDAYVRTERLYSDDGNASRQARDAARAQDSVASAHVSAAIARARLDWGSRLIDDTAPEIAALKKAIARGDAALVRAEFPGRLPDDARQLRYELLDPDETHPGNVVVTYLERSRAPVQSTPGEGVLIAIESTSGPVTLRPGERRTIVAASDSGSSRPVVPAQAAFADAGRLWCYVTRNDTTLERIPLDADAETAAGFPLAGAVAPDARVVVSGAPIVLSLERGARLGTAAGAAEEDER